VSFVPTAEEGGDSNFDMVVVAVDAEYRDGPDDDGLRELSDEQCEREEAAR
jgi:hypothetical protein